jgi:hypothetical protein
MSESQQVLEHIKVLDPLGIYRSMDEVTAKNLKPEHYKQWQQVQTLFSYLLELHNRSTKENVKMPELTPDQVDILSEIEETIQKLTTIASRVERGKPIGSLLSIKSNRLNYLFGRYQMRLDLESSLEPRKTAEEITSEALRAAEKRELAAEIKKLEAEKKELEAERSQIEVERKQLEAELRELESEIEGATPESEEDWLKRIGGENTEQQISRIVEECIERTKRAYPEICKAFQDIKINYVFKPSDEVPTVTTEQLIENHEIWEKEQRAKRSKKTEKDEAKDDRISVESLANMSAADALALDPKQHKKWLAIQRERYNSQYDDFQ